MHWILRILRRNCSPFLASAIGKGRLLHRNGQSDLSASRRNTKNFIANSIRQSETPISLGETEEGRMRREMKFRWIACYRARNVNGRSALTLRFSLSFHLGCFFLPLLLLYISRPRYFTPFFFPRKWICFPRTERFVLLFRFWSANAWDQILLCRRWPVQTMTSWKVSLQGKQDEKYLAWFPVRLLSYYKLIERAGEIPSWTCTQLVGETTRHHDREFFLPKGVRMDYVRFNGREKNRTK